MATRFKGAPVAEALNDRIRADVAELLKRGVTPKLALVRVGEQDGDVYYERSAMRRCEAVGVAVRNVILPETATQAELLAAIAALNADRDVHGILVFRPLPKAIDDAAVRAAIAPEKDVDGITDMSMAGVFTGGAVGFCPCTAEACMEVLDYYGVDCAGKKAVVVGRSLVIGKPAAMLLLQKNATVTVCHTKTRDLAAETRCADILLVSAGHAGTVGAEHVRPGQVVLDVGVNTDAAGAMCGDVDFAAVEPVVAAITPVPGGVGTVTTSVLVRHVVEAAKRRA